MKKFIIKTFGYLTILALITFSYIFYKSFLTDRPIVKIQKQNIIIGDSNTRNGIDDKIFTSYQNFSQGGESYLYAYSKLKYLLNNGNKIDTLMLAFSPHNIINNKWLTEGGSLTHRLSAFMSIYDWPEHKILLVNDTRGYLKALTKIRPSFRTTDKTDIAFLGGYMPNPEIEDTANFKKFEKATPVISKMEIDYLNKIITLCKTNKIHLILINVPKNYRRPDFSNYDYPEFYSIYQKSYNNIDYLNLSRLPLSDSAYANINHLSYIGGAEFSRFLRKNGIKKLLHSEYNLITKP